MINAAISVLPWRFHGLRRKYSPGLRREPLPPPAGLFACIINSSVGLPSSGSTNALHSIPAHPRCCWTPAAAVALCCFPKKSPAGGLRQHQTLTEGRGEGQLVPWGPGTVRVFAAHAGERVPVSSSAKKFWADRDRDEKQPRPHLEQDFQHKGLYEAHKVWHLVLHVR